MHIVSFAATVRMLRRVLALTILGHVAGTGRMLRVRVVVPVVLLATTVLGLVLLLAARRLLIVS